MVAIPAQRHRNCADGRHSPAGCDFRGLGRDDWRLQPSLLRTSARTDRHSCDHVGGTSTRNTHGYPDSERNTFCVGDHRRDRRYNWRIAGRCFGHIFTISIALSQRYVMSAFG